MKQKRYRSKQKFGYRLLSDNVNLIDIYADYYIKNYAPACDDRPIIIRCDGKSFRGNDCWIVDQMNLIEIQDN